jgi:glycosyltransferase involved in cell wall biosynthesis
MHSPTLAELPSPPPGRTGWPWTIDTPTPPLPAARPDGSPWPRISIVTPSYNQGRFIEETIRSVLLQGYPQLEYIIVDGGSNDQSVEIIEKYQSWLSYWVSEPDRGQVHAINKGLLKSSGEIFQWLNSDDMLISGALSNLMTRYTEHALAASILVGKSLGTSVRRDNRNLTVQDLLTGRAIYSQPGFWFPRIKLNDIGLSEDFNYAFDWDHVIRYLEIYPQITYINDTLVFFRLHENSKTVREEVMFGKEGHAILSRLSHSLSDHHNRITCRETHHQKNWQRHLIEWAKLPRKKYGLIMRIIFLGFRNPRLRINRFWLGALRRMFVA